MATAATTFLTAQAEAMSEAKLQTAVLQLARFLGYKAWHFHDSRVQRGGRLVGDRDAKGFPDTVLVSVMPPRVIYAELKKQKAYLTKEQKAALSALGQAGQETHVWRPLDYLDGTIEAVLRNAPPR
jgi:hypothetical protein